jgi:hypothetical protein
MIIYYIKLEKIYIFQMRTLDILKYPLKKTCKKPQGLPLDIQLLCIYYGLTVAPKLTFSNREYKEEN